MNTQQQTPPEAGKTAADVRKDEAPETASAAFHDAARRFAEVREYISYYVAVQADAAKLAARNALFYAALGIIGVLGAGAAIVTAVVLLLVGLARAIGAALRDRLWAGELIVGVLVLVILALGAKVASGMLIGSSRRKTVHKYESLQRKQRTRFGQDVNERADG